MHLESVMAGTLMTAGANMLIQVTCVLAIGWLLERIMTRRGPEAVAFVQRATLVGLLLIPMAAIVVHSLLPTGGLYISLPEPGEMAGPLGTAGFAYLTLSAVWFVGALSGLMRLAFGMRMASLLVDASEPATGAWVRRTRQLARAERLPAKQIAALDVRVSPRIHGPCLVGLRRPVLLLPAAHLEACNDLVLLHELTHLRRSDNFWNALTSFARSCVWVHPLAWRLPRAHHVTSEHVCDDAVIARRPNAVAYVRTLLDFSHAGPMIPAATPAASLFGRRGELLDRSRRLLGRSDQRDARSASRSQGFTTLSIVALTLGSVVVASALVAVHHTATAALAGWALLWCAMP
ncbi:MAG: M56 family metallopeptidase [Planctomycetota bacterium]